MYYYLYVCFQVWLLGIWQTVCSFLRKTTSPGPSCLSVAFSSSCRVEARYSFLHLPWHVHLMLVSLPINLYTLESLRKRVLKRTFVAHTALCMYLRRIILVVNLYRKVHLECGLQLLTGWALNCIQLWRNLAEHKQASKDLHVCFLSALDCGGDVWSSWFYFPTITESNIEFEIK